MKTYLAAALAACLLLTGCQSKTDLGECIGAFDDGEPGLQYKLSIRNTVLGAIFVETVFVPVIVVATEARCPVARK